MLADFLVRLVLTAAAIRGETGAKQQRRQQ